jgi:hypothetical protein
MQNISCSERLAHKTSMHAIQVELQQGYDLSPVEAMVLACRLQQLVDEQTGFARQPGQITYQAIALDEPAGKPLAVCRKVPVHLTVIADDDAKTWACEGAQALRRVRIHRLTYEALLQGGALSQEDLGCILGLSQRSVKRVFAAFRAQGAPLPSRGELQDIGPGISHKIPLIRRYVRDVALSRIAMDLGGHGLNSLMRYLRHFALVMILQDRGLTPTQMRSVVGISENLIAQYQQLYTELQAPEYERALQRLKQSVFHDARDIQESTPRDETPEGMKKGDL